MLDDCDPASFNAALGAGTCVGSGKTTFPQFIQELTQTHTARKWRFLPPFTEVRKNAVLVAANLGGETHTFTHVQHFGGGIVPILNQLSNNPTVVPECTTLETEDFVAPGQTYRLPTRGVHSRSMKIQCRIHPGMRSVVEVDGRGRRSRSTADRLPADGAKRSAAR
ncbi:MAG: hypothetical protein M3081_07810 [Gemmatimonadota bacterium]|nr:hypothetical protein [Gemmatimonadota bacterium]